MGLLSSPLSRLVGLLAVVVLGLVITDTFSLSSLPVNTTKFVYLLSLCLFVGIGNWTTFVFGIVAFKTLPRNMFGVLQAQLFPKYFQVLTVSSVSTLVTFLSTEGATAKESPQFKILVSTILLTLINLVYLGG